MAQALTPTVRLKATEPQARFLASTASNVVFDGGAGSGKTYGGVLWSLLKALRHPGSPGMYVAATYGHLQQAVIPHLLTVADQLGQLESLVWHKAENLVTFANGSTIRLRSAQNPESLLGANLSWALGDEVALWKHLAYQHLQSRLRVTGYGPIQAAYTFTPKGKTWAADALLTPRDGLEIIHATTFDNPTLPPEFFERLRREYGEDSLIWRQEVLGEVVAWEGLVYPQFSLEKHVADPPDDAQFAATVYGVDWGWTNPGVILCGKLDAKGVLWLVDGEGETERGIDEWGKAALRLREKHGNGDFLCDPSEPGNIVALQRAGLRARRADNAVLPGLMALGSRIQADQLRVSPSLTGLISELLAYSYKTARDGTTRNDDPEKVNDHWCDAARYLNMGLTRPKARGHYRR